MSIISRLFKLLTGAGIEHQDVEAEQETFLPAVEQIEAAAADLKRGRALESEGRALVSRAKKVLERVPDGAYGVAAVARKPNTPVLDQRAARKLLEEQGLEVPTMQRADTITASITETPAEFVPEPVAVAPAVRDWTMSDLLADLDAKLAA
ncbi:hypothetical protein [Streptomyces sp. gCLA4]|uniref:hypothetical protein n=1 Tax=Streptomyces sp. gCLA4 TaxID=1873416 RepID=UPI001602C7DB|nr:hypothetical protein [Streptomyces sp. gCLA4]